MCISDWSSDVCSPDLAEPNDPARLRERIVPLAREWWIYLASFGGVAVVWQLIQRTWTVQGAMHLVLLAFLLWFAWFLVRHCNRIQRQQMLSLVAMILGVLVFFVLYEQTYGSDRKSTRLNSRSLMRISYAVFCLKK